MARIDVKYNPYKLKTDINVNGNPVESDSALYKYVKGKRLQEWIGNFPQELKTELNSVDFDVEFYGMELDWDDFEFAFTQAKAEGVIKNLSLRFVEGKTDDDITEKIVEIFDDLSQGPLDDFRDPKIQKAFANINHSVFPVNVIATMSSGKSTLINALLAYKLMPSKNEACTATITEITDNDEDGFSAVVYNQNDEVIEEIENLDYEEMDRLNSDENVHRIIVDGDIPFIDAKGTALQLVDTPGPNNSQNQAHKNTTYRAINNDSNNLILYVLNGTQIGINDDASLLDYVSEKIKLGGKIVRDRFLFVINKMDGFNPEEESIADAVAKAREYLANHGIDDPQIFPCSAYTALNIRTLLKGIDIDNLSRAEEKKLPSAARETLPMIDKFNEYDQMHLETYSILSPSTKRELEYALAQATEKEDTKEQALIHCGIYSIEAAIKAYVKKYAKTKKVKDLVESFQEVLESSQVLTKAKTQVATDEDAAAALAERARVIRERIENGKDAEMFKARIAAFDPMESIVSKADELEDKLLRKVSNLFEVYGDTITSKSEVKTLVKNFSRVSSDSIAEMSAELDSVINKELVDTGEKLLKEYQNKLTEFDESAGGKTLEFDTVDLIKGALQNMRESAETWGAEDFITSTIEKQGETTYEERKYHVKVGQEAEEVIVGSHEEKIGTRKVKVGSHREKRGTQMVKNPEKKWWSFWRDDYVEKDRYVTVDDYKDEDVYQTVMDYQTIMRDVFEERTERIEKFSLDVSILQTGLVAELRENLSKGIENAQDYARSEIMKIKTQFTDLFDELDQQINEKYAELEVCANDQQKKEAELERNRSILAWIEDCKKKMEDILEV